MKFTRTKTEPLKIQRKKRANKKIKPPKKYDGNTDKILSTGSTLLDLEISGGRTKEGGIPSGILMEVFGPNGCGKTALLCELAGGVQRCGGNSTFMDPEARLDRQFARIFGASISKKELIIPDTPVDVFSKIRDLKVDKTKINGIFVDSSAALNSDLEMKDKSDEYSRRAKLFSQECRKTCRKITHNDLLVVFSNQIRQKIGATQFEEQFTVPGGEAIPFYASLRLRFMGKKKIKEERSFNGRKVEKVKGIETRVQVYKSSVWKPYGEAPLTIIFDYGIDDIRENLQYLKTMNKYPIYQVNKDIKLDIAKEKAIRIVEKENLQQLLKKEVIKTWKEVEQKFVSQRTPKHRTC